LSTPATRLLSALLLLFALALVVEASRIAWGHLMYSRAEIEASFWGQKNYVPKSQRVASTFSDIENARALQPYQPDFMLLQSHMQLWRAFWSEQAEVSDLEQARAVELLLAAALLRPAHRATWERLVREKQRLGQDDIDLALARSRVRLLSVSVPAP
jgi:hypothetical protein